MPHLGILCSTAVHAPLTQTPNHSQNRRGRRTLQSYPHETGTEQEHRTGTGMKNSKTEVREATRLISSNDGKSRGRARTERIPNPQRNKHSGAAASRRRRCLPEASSATAGARASASGIRSEEARTRNPISASLVLPLFFRRTPMRGIGSFLSAHLSTAPVAFIHHTTPGEGAVSRHSHPLR
jgi:hypothetical protein